MEIINFKYQFFLFGLYEDIQPTPDTIKFFLDSFLDKKLIPTTVQDFSLDGIQNSLVNRLKFQSPDNTWEIEINPKTLVISKQNNVQSLNTNIGDINLFVEEAKSIVKVINDKFPKKHRRLGLVTRYVLPELSKEQFDLYFKNSINSIELFGNFSPVDYSNRVVKRILENINESREDINIVCEIKGRLDENSNFKEKNKVELKFDLNTFQGDESYRFDKDDIYCFYDIITKIEEKLKHQYINLLSRNND